VWGNLTFPPIDPADPQGWNNVPDDTTGNMNPARYRYSHDGDDPPLVGSAPTISITDPDAPATITAGESITLTATAADTEDGDITSSIVWTSTLDGALGTGGTIEVTLSEGNHTIRASITDSDTNERHDTVAVTVEASTSGSTFGGSGTLSFSGAGTTAFA